MVEHIEERFLNSRDLFALRYKEGLVFMEVEEFEDTTYEEFSNLEDIEAGTSLDDGYQRLEDTNSDDILFVPAENEFTVLHVGIGIAPSVIEMFIGYPEGTRNRGSLPNLGSARPTPGANLGMIDGGDSPYRSPTQKTELVIPPKQRVEFDFNNPGDDAHEPLLKFVIRKYKVNPLSPENGAHGNAISRILGAGSPAPIFPVGNLDVKADYNMEEDWELRPATRAEAKRAMSGGRR